MELTKEDLELFIQFKQFMSLNSNMEDLGINKKKTRREKGTGSVVKLSGTRKRPYLASVTVGYDDYDGRQIQKPLAYFITREHANKALDLYLLEKEGKCNSGTVIEYIATVNGKPSNNTDTGINLDTALFNKNTFKSNCPTFAEIWDDIFEKEIKLKSRNTIINYNAAFKNLKSLHSRKIDSIKLDDLQYIFDEMMDKQASMSKLNNMKVICKYVFDYAFKYDMIKKNYADFIRARDTRETKKVKDIYSKDMIAKLFANDDDIYVQSILVMIYTGMRPSELIQLKKENVHLEERYLIGGIKTKNGIDRVIPIHSCIAKYIENIINSNVVGVSYHTYFVHFQTVKEKLGFNCSPHSGRHTFATLANEYELNEFLIKRIMGHSTKDLTKDVYTRTDKERLIKEIEKLPCLR